LISPRLTPRKSEIKTTPRKSEVKLTPRNNEENTTPSKKQDIPKLKLEMLSPRDIFSPRKISPLSKSKQESENNNVTPRKSFLESFKNSIKNVTGKRKLDVNENIESEVEKKFSKTEEVKEN
jgi:hypothetical protein